MFESKEEKKGKGPLKCRFKSIYIFGEFDVGKGGEFLAIASEFSNV